MMDQRAREIAEENLRMRILMQKDTIEILKLREEVKQLKKEIANAQQPPDHNRVDTGGGVKLGGSEAQSPTCRPSNGDLPHASAGCGGTS